MRIRIACLVVAQLIISNAVVCAQDDDEKKMRRPDTDNGSSLAQRWCVSCHVVASEQSKGSDATPSFASIAQRADFNAEKLAYFLLNPHPIMPNMSLSRDAARDIAAYIARLRK